MGADLDKIKKLLLQGYQISKESMSAKKVEGTEK